MSAKSKRNEPELEAGDSQRVSLHGIAITGDDCDNDSEANRHSRIADKWFPSYLPGGSSVTEEVGLTLKFISPGQKLACLISHVLSLIAMIMVVCWINKEEMGGGGVSWAEGDAPRVFNWHPVMMVCCFCFMTVASLAFRVRSGILWGYRYTDRRFVKFIHGMAWLVALQCGLIGIIAVFKSHNDPQSGYIANMYSLHSWIGMGIILLYLYQMTTATIAFAVDVPLINAGRRASILSFHRFLGNFIYVGTSATILLGIQEKDGFVGCSYTVYQADTFPAEHIMEIPAVCRISHGLGIVIVLMALTTSYALYTFPEGSVYNSRVI